MDDGDLYIPEAVRIAFWNWHMEGYTPAEIARYSEADFAAAGLPARDCHSSEVRRVLSETPPQAVLGDLRYVHGVRAFWIAAVGILDDDRGTAPGMVFVFQPWRLMSKAFQKGVRAVCRDFNANCAAGDINPQVIEGIEMDVAIRMIDDKGVPAWIVSDDGSVDRYSREFSPGNDDEVGAPAP